MSFVLNPKALPTMRTSYRLLEGSKLKAFGLIDLQVIGNYFNYTL